MHPGQVFYDDMSGQPPDKDTAALARKTEIDFFRNMGVHTKTDTAEAKKLVAKIITTRWAGVSTCDTENPRYRSRLVGREVKRDNRPEIFVATPPLEALRMVLSIRASRQYGEKPYRALSSDIKRAYVFATAK